MTYERRSHTTVSRISYGERGNARSELKVRLFLKFYKVNVCVVRSGSGAFSMPMKVSGD